MKKFLKNLEQGLLLYSLSVNTDMLRYMSSEQILALLDGDKE